MRLKKTAPIIIITKECTIFKFSGSNFELKENIIDTSPYQKIHVAITLNFFLIVISVKIVFLLNAIIYLLIFSIIRLY